MYEFEEYRIVKGGDEYSGDLYHVEVRVKSLFGEKWSRYDVCNDCVTLERAEKRLQKRLNIRKEERQKK